MFKVKFAEMNKIYVLLLCTDIFFPRDIFERKNAIFEMGLIRRDQN